MLTRWIEIKARGKSGAKDEAASLLIKAGSPGVVEDVKGPLVNTLVSHSAWGTDVFPEDAPPAESAALIAYIRPPASLASRPSASPRGERSRGPRGVQDGLKDMEKDLGKIGWSFTSSAYRDRDWSQAWKAGIKPARVGFKGGALIVKPPWRNVDKRPGDIVINIEPGMAFGTGGHQTTKMCLRAIASLLTSPEFPPCSSSLLDVGAGSGVLAITAKKLRIKKAIGIDIDPEALKAARKNARLNRAEITVSPRPIEGGAPTRRVGRGRFTIVVANILAQDLKRLSRALKDKVAPGGALILSGILREEECPVSEVFTGIGLKPDKSYTQGEWAALVFRKPGGRYRRLMPADERKGHEKIFCRGYNPGGERGPHKRG